MVKERGGGERKECDQNDAEAKMRRMERREKNPCAKQKCIFTSSL
jgi:hypothetical protein